MSVQALRTVWREGGAAGVARTLSAVARMSVPVLGGRQRSGSSTGAYFDLVTADSRRFYGDNFHFGYFTTGRETLGQALDAHTDLVASLARLAAGQRVLDIGCGLGAPAIRMARDYGCRVTGINISREQVRLGFELIAAERMTGSVSIMLGDARELPFADASFDAVVCVEVAGDICVVEADKQRLVDELFRVLRPGGHVGFSDLALRSSPTRAERRALRAVFYDDGSGLATDWPAIFSTRGFAVHEYRSVFAQMMPTLHRIAEIHAERGSQLEQRYGPAIARRTGDRLARVTEILERLGTFPVFAAAKPSSMGRPDRKPGRPASRSSRPTVPPP